MGKVQGRCKAERHSAAAGNVNKHLPPVSCLARPANDVHDVHDGSDPETQEASS